MTDVIVIPMDVKMNHVRDMAEPDAFRKALNVRLTHAGHVTEVMADVDQAKKLRRAAVVIMRSKL